MNRFIGTVISDLTREEFIDQLTADGYVLIGSGLYSAVYAQHGGTTVIKVGSTIHDPWLNWAESILRSEQDNPWLPDVKEVSVYRKTRKHTKAAFYVAHMERLCPISYDDQNKYYSHLSHIRNTCVYEDVSNVSVISEMFGDMVKLVKATLNQCDGRYDFHFGNIMLRGQQIVVTDPIAG